MFIKCFSMDLLCFLLLMAFIGKSVCQQELLDEREAGINSYLPDEGNSNSTFKTFYKTLLTPFSSLLSPLKNGAIYILNIFCLPHWATIFLQFFFQIAMQQFFIQFTNSNLWPLDHEPSALTTRPDYSPNTNGAAYCIFCHLFIYLFLYHLLFC